MHHLFKLYHILKINATLFVFKNIVYLPHLLGITNSVTFVYCVFYFLFNFQ